MCARSLASLASPTAPQPPATLWSTNWSDHPSVLSRWVFCCYTFPHPQCQARRKPVQKWPYANRSNLTIAKQTRQWQRPQLPGNHARVMVVRAEHPDAAPIARAQHSGNRLIGAQARTRLLQQLYQIPIRRGSIAQLELDRLPHLWKCTDRKPAPLPLNTDQGTNQKTTSRKAIAILVGSQPHQQVVACAPLHLGGKILQRLNQQVIGRAVRYSLDQIAAYLRNRPRLTNWLASLRNQWQDSVRAAYRQSHAALVEDIIVQENKRASLRRIARSQPTQHRPARVRSEEHTSELQSPGNLVCRLLLEKRNYNIHFALSSINQKQTTDSKW